MSKSNADNAAKLVFGILAIVGVLSFFSGERESKKLQRSLDELINKVDRLEQKVDGLYRQMDERHPLPPPKYKK
jgi:tetrahydromethanopterin S-methyltransferase subunit B